MHHNEQNEAKREHEKEKNCGTTIVAEHRNRVMACSLTAAVLPCSDPRLYNGQIVFVTATVMEFALTFFLLFLSSVSRWFPSRLLLIRLPPCFIWSARYAPTLSYLYQSKHLFTGTGVWLSETAEVLQMQAHHIWLLAFLQHWHALCSEILPHFSCSTSLYTFISTWNGLFSTVKSLIQDIQLFKLLGAFPLMPVYFWR